MWTVVKVAPGAMRPTRWDTWYSEYSAIDDARRLNKTMLRPRDMSPPTPNHESEFVWCTVWVEESPLDPALYGDYGL